MCVLNSPRIHQDSIGVEIIEKREGIIQEWIDSTGNESDVIS